MSEPHAILGGTPRECLSVSLQLEVEALSFAFLSRWTGCPLGC